MDSKSSEAPTVGGSDNSDGPNSSDDSDNPDNPTMACDRAAVQVAPGANPNSVQDVTVKWYVDVLRFPESTAKALYTS